MKGALLAAALSVALAANAQEPLRENFAKGIPASFATVNGNGAPMSRNIYDNLGDETTTWIAGQLANGYGRAALAPTRRAGEQADCWLILPEIEVTSPEAVIRWEARSLHRHIAESYTLKVKTASSDWTDLYTCPAESHTFTMHSVSLAEYTGQRVQAAFVANTSDGFVLAVDNILAGVPDDLTYAYASRAPHYVDDSAPVTIQGTLAWHGMPCPWVTVCLDIPGLERQSVELPALYCGDEADIAFAFSPEVGRRYDYTLTAISADGTQTLLATDFVSCSHFPRHHVIDRCSGTWCNECPKMEITTTRLENLYADQLTVVEAHVRDMLTNTDYWTQYLGEHVFGIPMLIPNHDTTLMTTRLQGTDDFSASLATETLAGISAKATLTERGDVEVSSTVTFADATDNGDDHLRVAYMLLGDVHEPGNPHYLQSSSALTFTFEQYYYQPDRILPEMMYYDNVPVDASVAYTGVPASLPSWIAGREEMAHRHSLVQNPSINTVALNVLAMVIDTRSCTILNACTVPVETGSGIGDIEIAADSASETEYYDISGRRLGHPGTGLTIVRSGSEVRKLHIH